jgi:hypothetical protein
MKKAMAVALMLLGSMSARAVDTGAAAPGFTLTDVDGKTRSLSDHKGKWVVLEWVNHGCPFVEKHYGSGNMQALQSNFTSKGVVWLSIGSSAKGKEGFLSPAEWQQVIQEKNAAPTAVLLDGDGKTGRAYGAKTTPHMFVINPEGKLVYQGAIDSVPGTDPAEIAGAKNYVRQALEESLAGQPVSEPKTKPYGCSVKYKK